jgi:hypothetical protein
VGGTYQVDPRAQNQNCPARQKSKEIEEPACGANRGG